jgi:potassium efflux system protein
MPKDTTRTARLLLLLALWISPGFAWAQTATPTPTSTPIPMTQTTPIPLPEVSSSSETVLAELRDLDDQLQNDQILSNIQAALPVLKREIDARLRDNNRILQAHPSLDSLRQLERDWGSLGAEFPGWKRDLATRVSQLQDQVGHLDLETRTWTKTLSGSNDTIQSAMDSVGPMASPTATATPSGTPTSTSTPGEVVNDPTGQLTVIRSLLSAIHRTRDRLVERQGQIFSIQTRVFQQAARVSDALANVTRVRNQTVIQVFVQDSPALWSREVRTYLTPSLLADAFTSVNTQLTALIEYMQRESGRLVAQVFIYLLFFALFRWLRGRIDSMVGDDLGLIRATQVLRMPASTALLLSLLLVHWSDPSAPRLLTALLGAVALLPSLAILRRLIEPYLFPLLNALMVFYVVNQVRAILTPVPLLARLVLLVETVGGCAFLVWMDRYNGVRTEDDTRSRGVFKYFQRGIRVVGVIFLADTIANVLGFVSLATLIGNGMFGSIDVGVIFYGILKILDGVMVFLFRIPPLALLNGVQKHRSVIRRRIYRLLTVVAVYYWALFTLELLSLREPVTTQVKTWLTNELVVGSIHLSLGHLLAFGLTIWLASQFSRFTRFVLDEEVFPHVTLGRGVPYALSQSIHYAILILGILTALGALGVDMTKITVVAGALSVGIGFGLQNIVNNFISGLILLIDRPVNVGDVLQLGEFQGELKVIGMRSSILNIKNGSEVIIPNSDLINQRVVNWSRSGISRRVDIKLTLENESDPDKVVKVLTEVAEANENIATAPAPQVFFMGFAGKSFDVELRGWVKDLKIAQSVKSELVMQSSSALARAGIQLAEPPS